MGTVTKELDKAPPDSAHLYLLGRPQRLGLLPTWWFWNQKDNWRLIRLPIVMIVLGLYLVLDILATAPLVGAVTAAVVLMLTLGLTERYIRRRAVDRRALSEARDHA